MLRSRALVIAVLALAACKDDKKPETAAKAAPDAAAKPPAAPDAAARDPKAPPLLPEAPAPAKATAAQCQELSEYTLPTLKLAAEARKVPADKSAAVAKELAASLLEQCNAGWPAGFYGCMATSPQDLDSYRRCFERLPAATRTAWNARLDEVLGAAGGTTYPEPARTGVQGVTFEALCPAFVAEVTRLDSCAGAMYLPDIEAVFAAARQATVEDVIPADRQEQLRLLCEPRAMVAREAASRLCQ
jgi:hypothetical protein